MCCACHSAARFPFHRRIAAADPCKRKGQILLYMNLTLYPRFYRSLEKTFGLRGWLAPEETRDLSTPGWLTEDPISLRRVERARAQGYDIEKIIAEDRLEISFSVLSASDDHSPSL